MIVWLTRCQMFALGIFAWCVCEEYLVLMFAECCPAPRRL